MSGDPGCADPGGGHRGGGPKGETRALFARTGPRPGGPTLGPRRGDTIGRYRLGEPLGEGGMGRVFLAEQDHPVRRRVAIKLIKPGLDTEAVIRRFNAGRSALASMQHPNIATVFEADSTPAGHPYFVMEYVPGRWITRFADAEGLGIEERLQLFLQACDAISHAHQRGLIHRDLKPPNVLAFERDGRRIVKVIDFGIAKALAAPDAPDADLTDPGVLLGSHQAMSPEQAAGTRDLDARTDVYALGLLLAELVAGVGPCRPDATEDPPEVSSRFEALPAEAQSAIAGARGTTAAELRRRLVRELDLIPAQATRSNRESRYATVADLRDDVEAYLDGRPLEAAPEGGTYRLRKRLARHRRPAAVVAAVVLILLVAGIVSGVARVRAEREATRARASEALAVQREQEAGAHAQRARREAYFRNFFAARAAIEAGDAAGARARLEACPESLRHWEWRWLHARTDNARLVLHHGGEVSSAVFCADGRSVLTASADRTARLWDTETGNARWGPADHGSAVRSAAAAPSGGVVVTVERENRVHLRDSRTGASLAEHRADAFAIDPASGATVVASPGGVLSLLDQELEARILAVEPARVEALAFAPSGRSMAAVLAGGGVCVRAFPDGQPPWRWPAGEADPVQSVAFSADGDLLALRLAGGGLAVREAATGEPLPAAAVGLPFVTSLAWPAAGAAWPSAARRAGWR